MEKRKDLSRSEGGALHRGRTSRIVGRALPPTYTRDDQEPGKAAIGKYSRVVLRVVDVRKATRN